MSYGIVDRNSQSHMKKGPEKDATFIYSIKVYADTFYKHELLGVL